MIFELQSRLSFLQDSLASRGLDKDPDVAALLQLAHLMFKAAFSGGYLKFRVKNTCSTKAPVGKTLQGCYKLSNLAPMVRLWNEDEILILKENEVELVFEELETCEE